MDDKTGYAGKCDRRAMFKVKKALLYREAEKLAMIIQEGRPTRQARTSPSRVKTVVHFGTEIFAA